MLVSEVGRPALRLSVWASGPRDEGEIVLTLAGVLAILLGIACTVGVYLLSGQTPGRRRKGQLGYFNVGGSGAFALGNVAPVIPAPYSPLGQRAGLGTLPTFNPSPAKERRLVQLAPDTTVSFAAVRRAAAIDDVFAALDRELVGLAPVKKRVREIGSLLLVDHVRHQFGLVAPRPNLHMCFTGPPGTGKTTVGFLMADLLHRLGYLEHGHLVHAMRDDLVGEYIGQTAPKTKRLLNKAMGGVLFIDEASALYQPDNAKDYGQEAIEILLQVMENDRDKVTVILAGYKDRMDVFFESNPGLRSRVAHHLDFAAFDPDELVAIATVMLERAHYYLSDEAEAAFRRYLTLRMQQPLFANARSVRNELERARLRHAHRLASDEERSWSRDELMRIERADILASRVFLGDTPDAELAD
jgi:probable Rubsico expression protein CbbX